MSKVYTKENTTEKKKKPLKKIIMVFVFLEVTGFLTAIGFFIAAVIAGFDGYELASTGGSIFFGVLGSSVILIISGVVIASIRSRKRMQTSYVSGSSAQDAPYTTENYPDYVSSSKKKVYYCSYCGYGSDSPIGKCPECGGPIRKK